MICKIAAMSKASTNASFAAGPVRPGPGIPGKHGSKADFVLDMSFLWFQMKRDSRWFSYLKKSFISASGHHETALWLAAALAFAASDLRMFFCWIHLGPVTECMKACPSNQIFNPLIYKSSNNTWGDSVFPSPLDFFITRVVWPCLKDWENNYIWPWRWPNLANTTLQTWKISHILHRRQASSKHNWVWLK